MPDQRRGQAFGLASTVLQVAQGGGMALAGLLAEVVGPPRAVASAGAVGVLAALALGRSWRGALAANSRDRSRAGP